jgi:hypothetical protein
VAGVQEQLFCRVLHGGVLNISCSQILESIAIPVNLDDKDALIKAANT